MTRIISECSLKLLMFVQKKPCNDSFFLYWTFNFQTNLSHNLTFLKPQSGTTSSSSNGHHPSEPHNGSGPGNNSGQDAPNLFDREFRTRSLGEEEEEADPMSRTSVISSWDKLEVSKTLAERSQESWIADSCHG